MAPKHHAESEEMNYLVPNKLTLYTIHEHKIAEFVIMRKVLICFNSDFIY